MIVAAGWTWPSVIVVVALIGAFTCLGMVVLVPRSFKGMDNLDGGPRLKKIEGELSAIRADLADLKRSMAELDRLFKSVG